MRHFFETHNKTDCTKCRYSRQLPLSSQLTCTHPLAQVERHFSVGKHGQPYWPVSFDPEFLTSCPCRGFQETKTAA